MPFKIRKCRRPLLINMIQKPLPEIGNKSIRKW